MMLHSHLALYLCFILLKEHDAHVKPATVSARTHAQARASACVLRVSYIMMMNIMLVHYPTRWYFNHLQKKNDVFFRRQGK